MAIHSGILAWKIPQTEKPGGHSPWGRKEKDMQVRKQQLELDMEQQTGSK